MENDIIKLCNLIRETSYSIHQYHGHGHLEKVHENALGHRLRKLGVTAEQQFPLTVKDEDGEIIGEYFADLFINQKVIVELKAAKNITNEHEAQLLGYLKSSRVEHGLLINFGSFKFQIKKYVFSQTGTT